MQPVYTDLPFKQLWNASYWEDVEPSMIKRDPRPGSPANRFWWGSNQVEVGAFWNSYDSLWVSAAAMGDQPSTVADAKHAFWKQRLVRRAPSLRDQQSQLF